MTTKNLNALKRGLAIYGARGAVGIRLNGDRAVVTVDGEYYGIWDVVKATFVD